MSIVDASAAGRAPDRRLPWHWPWPLPAAAAWLAAWVLFAAARPLAGPGAAALLACAAGALIAWRQPRRWRRAIVGLGFPASALASGAAASWPAWVWLLPLALLALAYPLRGWRDAPLFPTPAGALDALAAHIALPAGARALDAGCGLGDGMLALRRAWPHSRIEGVELSPALAWLARRRCPWADVQRGDMWARSWQGAALVYVFQRPETMARAWDKARAELAPGAWLVSLGFEVPGQAPTLVLAADGVRTLYAWRMHPRQPSCRPEIAQQGCRSDMPQQGFRPAARRHGGGCGSTRVARRR